MPNLAASARCFYHPDRPALAICVDCRKPICQSCSTLWEGLHLCVECLAKRRSAVGERGLALRSVTLAALSLALLFGLTFLRSWIGAFLAEAF